MTDPRPATPLGFATGVSLAFAASVGIFAAYWIGHGAPALFWIVLVASLFVGFGLGLAIQRFALPDRQSDTTDGASSSGPASSGPSLDKPSSKEPSSTESSSS